MDSRMNRDAPAFSFGDFSDLKRNDRLAPGGASPSDAQAAADAILHPRLWQIADGRQLAWPGDLADASTEGPEIMESYVPEDLAAIFRALQAAGWDAILVGGQAVNLWASHYEGDDPAWEELRPYASRDLDYYGGLSEARLAMRALGAQGRLNTNFDPGPNAGVLKVPLADGRVILMDVLTGVYGVSSAEVEGTAVTWSGTGALSGLTMRVIHPLLLLEGKAASLRGLPQADRQDAKHLRILVLVVHEWLRQQLGEPRVVFRAVERLAACAASPDGMHAFVQRIDLVRSIPLDKMRGVPDFARFFERRWPQLWETITRRRERHLDALREQER